MLTELGTALGLLGSRPWATLVPPAEFHHVPTHVWTDLVAGIQQDDDRERFDVAFANGQAFLDARDGLRGRPPVLVEWKGPHRLPGDDVVPVDLRVDHVYQISCKYRSRVMQNAGPARLFDHALATETRGPDWFQEVAPAEYQRFYAAARGLDPTALPVRLTELGPKHRQRLRELLRERRLPAALQDSWQTLSTAVAAGSTGRWRNAVATPTARLRMVWRLLRISDAPYFLLGTSGRAPVRLRVSSTWDWHQRFELRELTFEPRPAGQPEVAWRAVAYDRELSTERSVEGHVEVRWSHGRFSGAPESKIYLDTPIAEAPGYHPLV